MIHWLSTMRYTERITCSRRVKQFLKRWIMGMKACSSSIKKCSLLERKNAIKLSADVAMASTRTTRWGQAIIANASRDSNNKHLIDRILESKSNTCYHYNLVTRLSTSVESHCARMLRMSGSKKRNYRWRARREMKKAARVLSKRLVRKRTQVLKNLVPGGETMDESSLMKEAIDYIISLQTQVDGMKHLINAVTTSKS